MGAARLNERMFRAPIGRSVRLLYGVFAAPFAWIAQLVISYALAASSCFADNLAKTSALNMAAVRLSMVATTVICVAIAASGFVTALRERGVVRSITASDIPGTRRMMRSRTLAHVGVLSSALFLAALVYSIVAFLMSPACAR